MRRRAPPSPRLRPARGRALLVGTVLLLAAGAPAGAGEGWWGALDEGEAVSLADVLQGPRDYRDRLLTFQCLFHTAEGEFQYYPPNTPFSPQRHVNFSVWPDGAPVWLEEAFKNDLPFLYLGRTHAQRRLLQDLEPFTRLELTGRIREIVRGRPAIEVFSLRTTGHRVGRQVVDGVMRGNAYARTGTPRGWQLAARAYEEALRPDLPPVYETQVRKLVADALRALGRDDAADRYEAGESVGLPAMPAPEPGADGPTASAGTPPSSGDLPAPFTDADDGRLRRAPETPAAGDPDGGAAPGPGPGSPDGGADVPPLPQGFDEAPPAAPAEAPPPSRSARSGVPPKRKTRLSGVR